MVVNYANAQPEVTIRNKINHTPTNRIPYFGVIINIPISNISSKIKYLKYHKEKRLALETNINDDPSLPFSIYRTQNCERFTCYYEYQYNSEDDPGVAWAHNQTQGTV